MPAQPPTHSYCLDCHIAISVDDSREAFLFGRHTNHRRTDVNQGSYESWGLPLCSLRHDVRDYANCVNCELGSLGRASAASALNAQYLRQQIANLQADLQCIESGVSHNEAAILKRLSDLDAIGVHIAEGIKATRNGIDAPSQDAFQEEMNSISSALATTLRRLRAFDERAAKLGEQEGSFLYSDVAADGLMPSSHTKQPPAVAKKEPKKDPRVRASAGKATAAGLVSSAAATHDQSYASSSSDSAAPLKTATRQVTSARSSAKFAIEEIIDTLEMLLGANYNAPNKVVDRTKESPQEILKRLKLILRECQQCGDVEVVNWAVSHVAVQQAIRQFS